METDIAVLILGTSLLIVSIILKVTYRYIKREWNIETPLEEIGDALEDEAEQVIYPNKEIKIKKETIND